MGGIFIFQRHRLLHVAVTLGSAKQWINPTCDRHDVLDFDRTDKWARIAKKASLFIARAIISIVFTATRIRLCGTSPSQA